MTPLGRIIRDIVGSEGPITVERFMTLALGHPQHGYYRNRDPLGAAGDFTTAPEISQMFGELLGLWAAETWTLMGRPKHVRLIELGPGRGTLMADALRAARVLPRFLEAIEIDLVETSPVLREAQRAALAGVERTIRWHDGLDTIPAGPAIVLANEFLDALPIRQFVRGRSGWHERLVGLASDGEGLAFGLAPEADLTIGAAGQSGDILELGVVAASFIHRLADRLARDGGAALLIDYGHVRSSPGETLQAVRRHGFTDPLAEPGEADLTAHVDFEAVGRAASVAGARQHGPVTQGDFLRGLGIQARAARLGRDATPEVTGAIGRALDRLIGHGPDQMGTLFKAMAISEPALSGLSGFPVPSSAPSASPCLETA